MSSIELITIIAICIVSLIVVVWLIAASAAGVAEQEFIEYEDESQYKEI